MMHLWVVFRSYCMRLAVLLRKFGRWISSLALLSMIRYNCNGKWYNGRIGREFMDSIERNRWAQNRYRTDETNICSDSVTFPLQTSVLVQIVPELKQNSLCRFSWDNSSSLRHFLSMISGNFLKIGSCPFGQHANLDSTVANQSLTYTKLMTSNHRWFIRWIYNMRDNQLSIWNLNWFRRSRHVPHPTDFLFLLTSFLFRNAVLVDPLSATFGQPRVWRFSWMICCSNPTDISYGYTITMCSLR